MNIAVIATGGSRGDVQPGMVLAHALKSAGHHPVLCVTEDFVDLAAPYEVEVCPVRVNTRELVQSIGGIEMIETEKNPIKMWRAVMALAKPLHEQTVIDAMPVVQDSELVLSHFGSTFSTGTMAEVAQVPLAIFSLVPAIPTREFPAATFPLPPAWLPFKKLYNQLSNEFAMRALSPMVGGAINALRAKYFDLPPSPPNALSKLITQSVMLHGISPSVIPRPADWPDTAHQCGYWFEPEFEAYAPPPALVEFLTAGAPPVYIGFGSMSTRKPEETTQLMLEAVEKSGVRAVIAAGWAGLRADDLPATIHMLEDVSHRWLFPRVAAAVHHGGAGTTAAAFRAGIPSVIVPHFADQFFWGQQAQQLGVSPKPIPRSKLTADALAQAILRCVSDTEMRRRAADLGMRIRSENGAECAVRVIERML